MKKSDVYVYGDLNVDIIVPGIREIPKSGTEAVIEKMLTFTGGGAALFAMGCAKLGLRCTLQSSVGSDCYGEYVLQELKRTGVDTSLIKKVSDEKTGVSISFTDEKDRSFITYRGTNSGISVGQMDDRLLSMTGHVHMTGYEGSKNHKEYLDKIREIHSAGNITVSFDVGWDETGEWSSSIYELMPMIDVLFMNETEAEHYSRSADPYSAAKKISEYAGTVVIKLGSKGSLACVGGTVTCAEACHAEPVDPTGAGDSFNAGFIYGYLHGMSIDRCLKAGNICGAGSVSDYGGNTGFPLEAELKSIMDGIM